MTKGEALALVASNVAGDLAAGQAEAWSIFDNVTPADEERLLWAIGEVQSRLYRMGSRS